MSAGTRIPYDLAYRICRHVMETLHKVAASNIERAAVDQLEDAGSLRRQKDTIGDLDAIAVYPSLAEGEEPGWDNDPLFRVLNRIVDNPLPKPKKVAQVLWLANQAEPPEPPSIVLGTAVKGLKPGFKAATLTLRAKVGEVGLQVFRAEHDAYGWAHIRTTGPDEFGVFFLTQWKRLHGIAFGDEHKASIDGFLVDAEGKRVSVPTEHEAFAKCGMEYVPPEERERWIERKNTMREVMR